MKSIDWVVLALVVLPLAYFTAITIAGWFAGLRRGEAVTLLPARTLANRPAWITLAVALLGLAVAVPYFYYLWIPILPMAAAAGLWLRIGGLVLYLLGMAFALISRRALGRNWGVSTSTQVKLLQDHQLIQEGPYSVVRHPMYFGSWLALLGLIMIYPVWALAIMFLFMLISFSRRALREEAALAERFGAQWAAYRGRTRFIIPFIW